MRSSLLVTCWLLCMTPSVGYAQDAPAPGTAQPSQNTNAEDLKQIRGSIERLEEDVKSQNTNAENLEQIRGSIKQLEAAFKGLDTKSPWRDFGPIIAALIASLIAAVVAIHSLRKNTEISRRTFAEKAREEERKAIRTQIDEFYGPFLKLREASKFFYNEAFMPRRKEEEKKSYADKEGRYRTVIALAKGHKFEGFDAVLLDQIVELGKKTAKLIDEKIGLVDEPKLQAALAEATTHYKIIELGRDGKLFGGGEELLKFVFPYDFDLEVRAKLDALNKRLEELQAPLT